ncbi:hypothetical protein N8645_01340 [bacterium]|nr:hypothetical protein [bacterium]
MHAVRKLEQESRISHTINHPRHERGFFIVDLLKLLVGSVVLVPPALPVPSNSTRSRPLDNGAFVG